MSTMTGLRTLFQGRRILFPIGGVAVAAAALIAVPRIVPLFDRPFSGSLLPSVLAPAREMSVNRLPFTLPDVVAYFTTALETKPGVSGNRFVFSGRNDHSEDAFRIAVSTEGHDLVVAFGGAGDYSITLAREFFEAPFFARDETLHFFKLLERSHDGVATATLRRFMVRFTQVEHSDDFHLTIRFTPHVT
jgi:hypothetical protein